MSDDVPREIPFPRKIHSFVRRQGRLTGGQALALQTHAAHYCLDNAEGLIDFFCIFGRKAPVILEIGFGMGDSLVQQCREHPDWDFIGIEVHTPGVGKLLAALAQQNSTNIRIYSCDAVAVLQRCIASASLVGVQIFFPDPWPKRHHHKRRLIQADFVALIVDKLQVGGFLHLATDWEQYARQMRAVLQENSKLCLVEESAGHSHRHERPLTKFESQALQAGRPISDLYFLKKL